MNEELQSLLKSTTTLQWGVGDDRYSLKNHGTLLDSLPPNAYEFGFSMEGAYANVIDLKNEELIAFESGPCAQVLKEVNRFWTLKERYQQLKLPYRRGILMHGVPGTGKSGIVRIICEEVIAQGGLVAIITDASTFSDFIPILNKTNPNNQLVIVLEDVDGLVRYDEHEFLQLLDGISNDREGMLFIATTNHLQDIPERIYRPSRFDQLIEVGLPEASIRDKYITSLCARFGVDYRQDIAAASDGLSFAHMKELVISCLLFDSEIQATVERLKKHGNILDEEGDD